MTDQDRLDALKETLGSGVLVVGGGMAKPIPVPGLGDVVVLDGRSDSMWHDTRLEGIPREDPAWSGLGRVAMTWNGHGVEARRAGRLLDALECYRVALWLASAGDLRPGIEALTKNLWYLRENVRQATRRGHLLLRGDAGVELRVARFREVERRLDADREALRGLVSDDLPTPRAVLTNRRLLLLGGAPAPSLERLIRLGPPGYDSCLVAALEAMMMWELPELLAVAGVGGVEGQEQARSEWALYLQMRELAPAKEPTIEPALHFAFEQLERLRLELTAGGGRGGHVWSYGVSSVLQSLGRHLIRRLLRSKPDQAVELVERLQSRALVDWTGRGHLHRRTPHQVQSAAAPLTGSVNAVESASLPEVHALAGAVGAPLLRYVRMDRGYVAMVHDAKSTSAPIPLEDPLPLVQELTRRLPYSAEATTAVDVARGARDLVPEGDDESRDPGEVLRDLYRCLIPDELRGRIEGASRVVVIPDGALRYVPFCALSSPEGRHLVQDIETIQWPSASMAALLLDDPEVRRGVPMVLGVSHFEDLPILLGVEREVKAVASRLEVPPLEGADATSKSLLGLRARLGRRRTRGPSILHIASHGLLDVDQPMRSHVVLPGGSLSTGDLLFSDGGLPVDLVVLSACQTGSGQLHPDSLVGLTSAFLVAGACRVLATLWRVDDHATSILIQRFYRELVDGVSAATALQRAQCSMLEDPETREPSKWAAFGLVGVDDRPVALGSRASPREPDVPPESA